MGWLNILLKLVADLYLKRIRETQERYLKIKMAQMYVQGVIVGRKSTIGLIVLFFALSLMVLGAELIIGGVFYFLPWEPEKKVFAIVVLGGFLLCLPMGFIVYLLKEKTWSEAAGIDKITEEFDRRPALLP